MQIPKNEEEKSEKSPKKVENGLFIFRRDLRIVDNNGIEFLKSRCKNIYTIFRYLFKNIFS